MQIIVYTYYIFSPPCCRCCTRLSTGSGCSSHRAVHPPSTTSCWSAGTRSAVKTNTNYFHTSYNCHFFRRFQCSRTWNTIQLFCQNIRLEFLFAGSDEKTDVRDSAVETGGLLHHVGLWVQGSLPVLTLVCVSVPRDTDTQHTQIYLDRWLGYIRKWKL